MNDQPTAAAVRAARQAHVVTCDFGAIDGAWPENCTVCEASIQAEAALIDHETHLPELIEAVEKIMNCMGGKDGQSGWEAPEDVWEIAYHALALIKGGA